MEMNNEMKINENRDIFAKTCSSIINGVISFFVILLVMLFPLIYHDSYFDILETKYRVYWIFVVAMLVICLVLSLIMLAVDFLENNGIHARTLFSRLLPQNWRETFCVADIAVLIFWLILFISTFQSEYFFESIWGNEGRYTGLFLLTLYVASYFVISRFLHFKDWLVELFLLSGMVMCIIGITDYFQMDVLQFRGFGGIHPEQSTSFTSTVGNINTYTAYVALIMAVSGALFATSKRTHKIVWYYFCLVISFFAIIMGCSDNAYLALGALFAFLPLALFRYKSGIRRYLVIVATFFTVVQVIDWINQKYAEAVIGLDSLFQIIVTFSGLIYIVVVLWIVVAALYGFNRKSEMETDIKNQYFVKGWMIFLAIAFFVAGYAFFDANFCGNAERYGGLGHYLVFDDSWGTNRGYIWRKSIELYRGFSPMHKWFGYGPDTFGILTTNKIRPEMVQATSQVFDNAHNEYLQYLITIGPLGLAAYVIFLVSSIIRMINQWRKSPYIIGCCYAVICYAVQAVVNLNLPIATPVMWLLLSLGMAACRRKES